MYAPSPVLILKDDYPLEDYGRAAWSRGAMESDREKAVPAWSPICGCFITHKDPAEPAAARGCLRDGDFEWHPLQPSGLPGPNPLSENEALARLHRCFAETGQLIVRSADRLTDVWFAGVGDPGSLFVEFFPRGRTAPADGRLCYWMCQLQCAERLLKLIYRGASYAELCMAMPSHATRRDPMPPIDN